MSELGLSPEEELNLKTISEFLFFDEYLEHNRMIQYSPVHIRLLYRCLPTDELHPSLAIRFHPVCPQDYSGNTHSSCAPTRPVQWTGERLRK